MGKILLSIFISFVLLISMGYFFKKYKENEFIASSIKTMKSQINDLTYISEQKAYIKENKGYWFSNSYGECKNGDIIMSLRNNPHEIEWVGNCNVMYFPSQDTSIVTTHHYCKWSFEMNVENQPQNISDFKKLLLTQQHQ